MASPPPFDPTSVNLDTASPRDIICYLGATSKDYNGNLGARISAIFVLLITSTAMTVFPVFAVKQSRFQIPQYVYLFARYFGSGVIVATAFIHLLAPAYKRIGGNTCVGMTGGWALYPWVPGIVLTSVMVIFLLEFGAQRYVEVRYGYGSSEEGDDEESHSPGQNPGQANDSSDQYSDEPKETSEKKVDTYGSDGADSNQETRKFRQQIAGFLILEGGVVTHSVIIGLTLGTVGARFSILYPVIVFHQAFEGLGIGARMSTIPFPKKLNWLPWFLCVAYGITTPLAVAIGLGVRTTYNRGSYTANVVSGVLDSISAGILIYAGLVELLAKDFLFNPLRTRDNTQLTFMLGSVLLGVMLMALLGKWA